MKLTYKNGTEIYSEIGDNIVGVIEYGIAGKGFYQNPLKKISVTRHEIETHSVNWKPYIKKQLWRLKNHEKVKVLVEIEPLAITTKNFKDDVSKEIETMLVLLRNVYDAIEMNHLTDSKMVVNYVDTGNIDFKKSLGKRIFGYLQAKDQTFRNKVIKRQNRWRRKQKSNQ